MADTKSSRARVLEENKFIFSTADTCELFNISRETLSTWQKKGAPKYGRGKWDIKALMEWRYDGRNLESPEIRKLKAEAALKEAKAAQENIKLSTVRKEYIPVTVVQSEITRMMANMKKSLLAIGHNTALALASLDPEASETAKNEVDKLVNEALKELSEGRLYRNGYKKKVQK